jgi:hypothetical protein
MSNIMLFTVVHGRREILQQVIDHHEHLPWIKFAVCSTDEEVEFMNENGWYAYQFDNTPLGRKIDMGFRAALLIEGWQKLVLIGSDDFLSPEYVTKVEGLEVHFAGTKKLYFVDSTTWKATKHTYAPEVRGKMYVGAGRLLSRHAIERTIATQGCLYTWHKRNGLDFDSEQRLITAGFHPVEIKSVNPMVMDLKSEQNIWKYGSFRSRGHMNKEVTIEEVQKNIGYEKPKL